jgi:hypothetical protein
MDGMQWYRVELKKDSGWTKKIDWISKEVSGIRLVVREILLQ